MPVPKTPIYQNRLPFSDIGYIWAARQVFTVEPVPRKTKISENPSDSNLRGGVFPPDAPHDFTSAEGHDIMESVLSEWLVSETF